MNSKQIICGHGFRVVALTMLIGASTLVSAQDVHSGFYVGAGVGHVDQKDTCDDIGGSCDDTDTGWKLFGGYQFTQYLAVEGGYVDFGSADGDDNIMGTSVSFDADVSGFFASGVASWPINDAFSIFGKLGILYWDVDTDADGGGISVSEDENGYDVIVGVGAQYDFSDHFGVRAEWERYNNVGDSDTGTTDIDLISASFIYKF